MNEASGVGVRRLWTPEALRAALSPDALSSTSAVSTVVFPTDSVSLSTATTSPESGPPPPLASPFALAAEALVALLVAAELPKANEEAGGATTYERSIFLQVKPQLRKC